MVKKIEVFIDKIKKDIPPLINLYFPQEKEVFLGIVKKKMVLFRKINANYLSLSRTDR